MNVILKEDVKNLGRMGDTVDVKDGYARNYLLPKKLAIEASDRNLKAVEELKKQIARRLEKEKEDAKSLAQKLSVLTLTLRAKAGEEGKLFGSITTMDIEEALRGQGLEVDKKKITLEEPIKRLGSYTASVRLGPEATATLVIEVEAEQP